MCAFVPLCSVLFALLVFCVHCLPSCVCFSFLHFYAVFPCQVLLNSFSFSPTCPSGAGRPWMPASLGTRRRSGPCWQRAASLASKFGATSKTMLHHCGASCAARPPRPPLLRALNRRRHSTPFPMSLRRLSARFKRHRRSHRRRMPFQPRRRRLLRDRRSRSYWTAAWWQRPSQSGCSPSPRRPSTSSCPFRRASSAAPHRWSTYVF